MQNKPRPFLPGLRVGAEPLSNIHIADVLLRANRPLTVREIIEAIELYHPGYCYNKDFVRIRLAAFQRSKNVALIADKTHFKATYFLSGSLYQNFFRGSKVRTPDFSGTIIKPAPKNKSDHVSGGINLWNSLMRGYRA